MSLAIIAKWHRRVIVISRGGRDDAVDVPPDTRNQSVIAMNLKMGFLHSKQMPRYIVDFGCWPISATHRESESIEQKLEIMTNRGRRLCTKSINAPVFHNVHFYRKLIRVLSLRGCDAEVSWDLGRFCLDGQEEVYFSLYLRCRSRMAYINK